MISRQMTLGGGLLLCALSIWGLAAASASGAGMTAVTCMNVGEGGNYKTSHCETPQSAGNFETVEIPPKTPTEVEGKSTEAAPVLRTTIGGLALTVKCETAEVIEGEVENADAGTKHLIIGTAERVTYTECNALLKTKESRYCAIEEGVGPHPGTTGMISTNPLRLLTWGSAHQVLVEPGTGEVFTEFTILKKGSEPGTENECFFNGANMTVVVKGFVEGEVSAENHSHLTFTEANNGSGLTANKAAAKYLDTVGFYMAGAPETTVGGETF